MTLVLFFVLACFLPGGKTWGYTVNDCIRCHTEGSGESRLLVNLNAYRSSVHGREMSCLDCHKEVGGLEPARHGTRVRECAACHEQLNRHAADGSIACTACHPPHRIFPAGDARSSVNWRNLAETCGGCHWEAKGARSLIGRFAAFRIAAHPKQDFALPVSDKMCVGCHQGRAAHGEAGPINDQQCPLCHLVGAKKGGILDDVHVSEDPAAPSFSVAAGYVHLGAFLSLALWLPVRLWRRRRRGKVGNRTHAGQS